MKYLSIYFIIILLIMLGTSCDTEMPPFYPQIEFNSKPDSGNTTTIFEFHGQLMNEPGDIELFYRWDINDDSIWDTDYSISNALEHRFYTSGEYKIQMSILTSLGIDTTVTKTITVSHGFSAPKPELRILPESANFTTEFIFDASQTIDDEDSTNTLEFRWDVFDDGNWETTWLPENLFSYKFNEPGKFSVRLAAKDPSGEYGEIVKTINVHSRDTLISPMFTWTAEHMRVGEPVVFDASSTFYEGMEPRSFQYQWKFPIDIFFSDSSTNPITEFVFISPGDNEVSLLVTDQFGLTNQETLEVRVETENSPPTAEIGYASPYANIRSNFFLHTWNCSDDHLGSSLLEKRWDFNGDGNWDTPWRRESEFHHQFDSPGKFLVRLQIRDDGNNTDMDEKLVTISEFSNPTDFFVDSRDGQHYSTVKLGSNWWMAENLKYVVPEKLWEGSTNPFQYFKEDEETIENYGLFYNIAASLEDRDYKICPPGWRIPSKEDWESLFVTNVYPRTAKELVLGGAKDFNGTYTGYIDWSVSDKDTTWSFKETTKEGWFLSSSQHLQIQPKVIYILRLLRKGTELRAGYQESKYYVTVRCIKE